MKDNSCLHVVYYFLFHDFIRQLLYDIDSFISFDTGGRGKKNDDKKGLLGQIAATEIDAIRPPRFDAEMVAETVIRIIQTYSKRDRVSSFRVDDAVSGSSISATGDAILVFLSGIQSIDKVNRALRQRNMVALNAQVHMLHGSLPPERQRRVFKKTKPGEWKIVLSTNIAETSVTVEDVTHVVDCGMVKELRFDAVANMSSLQEVVVSRASARQRAGRAGKINLHTSPFHSHLL